MSWALDLERVRSSEVLGRTSFLEEMTFFLTWLRPFEGKVRIRCAVTDMLLQQGSHISKVTLLWYLNKE